MTAPKIEPLESRIAPAVISIAAPVATSEGTAPAGKTNFNFTISLDAVQAADVTVMAAVIAGSASDADGDYDIPDNLLVTIPAGQTSVMFTVAVNRDAKFETDETFSVQLSSPSGGNTLHPDDSEAGATILNDDAVPTIGFLRGVEKVDEGNGGTTQLKFTVALSNPSHQDVTFDWATALSAAVNAADGVDFQAVPTTAVTILAGSTQAELIVLVNGDTDNELEEEFFANISNALMGGSPLTITSQQARGLIGNDELLVSVTGAPVVVETNTGTINAPFTISIPVEQAFDVTVEFDVAGSGANPASVPEDVRIPASVTIPAGQTSAQVNVQVVGDTLFELAETFDLQIKNVVNAVINPAAASATGTITDNDDASIPAVSVVQLDSVKNEGSSGTDTTFTFRVQLNRASGAEVAVDLSLVDGLATIADLDFVELSYTENGVLKTVPPDQVLLVKIPAGQTQVPVTVKVRGDAKFESSENFSVQIANPVNATLAANVAQGTIQNDDALPTLNIADFTASEGNAGETDFNFVVTLSNPADRDVTFTWATVAESALAGSDFTEITPTQVTIPAGQTLATLTVKVAGDATDELDETFRVVLSGAALNSTPLNITDGDATGRIKNDELTVVIGPDVNVNEGAGMAEFTVSLAGGVPSSHDVVVTYQINAGTAAQGLDYTPPAGGTGTVTILAGQASATISVPILDDERFESAVETFTVKVLSAQHAILDADTEALGSITDNDSAPQISIADATISEGNIGDIFLTFTVSINRPADRDVVFTWDTAAGMGTATAGTDYTAVPSTEGRIFAGQTTTTVRVQITPDLIRESNETLFVNILTAMLDGDPVIIADGQAQGTITNDDPLPVLTVKDARILENDASGQLVFEVSIANPADQDITFNWGTALGTAQPGVDYTAVASATGTILAGQTTSLLTVAVPVNGDGDDEADETLFINVVNPRLADGTPLLFSGGDSQALGTIQNDDRVVSLSSATYGGAEGSDAVITIQLDSASTHDVVVQLEFTPVSALIGVDYTTPTIVTRTIPAGQTSVDVSVPLTQDQINEGDETFTVAIMSVTGAAKGATDSAVVTITDDDPVPTLSILDAKVAEGDSGTKLLEFRVRLSNPVNQEVKFDWATADGSAVSTGAFADFVSKSATEVVIPAGSTEVKISVVINGDTTDEGDETFLVNLSNHTLGGVSDPSFLIADGQATGTIQNDDITVRISNASLSEGDSGSQTMNFAVSLDRATTRPVTVTLALEEASALAGKDYEVPVLLEVTIPAGAQSVNFPVSILGDVLDELNETFTVRLVDATNAKLGNAVAVGTILDNDPTASLSIAGATVTEGNSGTTEVTFIVSLDSASGQAVTVNVGTLDGTAISTATGGTLADFTAASGVLTFLPERPDPDNPGQFLPAETVKEFKVLVNGDTRFEQDETFSAQLSNATGALIGTGSATATITNDDAQPVLSIGNVALAEGSGAGTTTFTFTLQLSALSGLAVTGTAATVDGTAAAGSDYTARSEAFSIPAGQLSTTFSVQVTKDGFYELGEAFSVLLSGVQNAALGNATATGTILNDDALPTLAIADLSVAEGDSGSREVEFTVTLSSVQNEDVTFQWQTANGTADGGDFAAAGLATETIAAGSTIKRLRVTVFGDMDDELDEQFLVNLSNAALLGQALTFTKASAVGKILNDDLAVSTGDDITVAEGDSGVTDAVFKIQLSAASTHAVTVAYTTQDGTATSTGPAADYQAAAGTVTFAPGETEKFVTVKINGDVNYDLANAFSLVISQPVNASLGDATATATIIEEPTDAKPKISVAGVSLAEDADGGENTIFRFTLTLDHASDETVVVTAQTLAGTALAGQDFTNKVQSLTFAPGETSKTFEVVVANDSVFEADETFRVVLSDPINATIQGGEATGTILADGDLAPRLKVTPQSIVEGSSGTRTMSFVVERIGATEAPVTFDFNTLGDTATAGVDFENVSQQFTILPGQTSITVNVLVNGDGDDEADEKFTVELSNLDGARLDPASDGTATGTIFNDDLTVDFQSATFSVIEANTGQSDLVFIVALSAVSAHDVAVTWSLAAGTAQSGTDFVVPTILTFTIPAGSATGEIRVPVLGDVKGENDETLSVSLVSVTNAALAVASPTATGTILNDDAVLTISDGHAIEGGSGTANMVFTVTLDGASVFPVTVHYTTASSTGGTAALPGTDFGTTGHVSGDLTFLPGETQKQILVPIKGDTQVEGDETFLVLLSDARANGVEIDALLDAEATGTIQDDEVFLSINDVTVVEGDSGTKQAVFTITVTPGSNFPVSVIATTMDDTAVSVGGSPDFVAKTETITFNPNQTTKTFVVTILGDRAFEPSAESFKVLLSGAEGALIVDGEGIGTISDPGDPPPAVSIADATIIEGDSGAKVLEFTVSLSEPVGADVLVDIATAFSGSADAGDIVASSIPGFVIPAGQRTAVFSVTVNGDADDEVDETFTVSLTNARTTLPGAGSPTTLTISDGTATGTILNDDLTVSIVAATSDAEGDTGTKAFKIAVLLSSVSNHPVTVTYNVAAGTAGSGDFTAGQNLMLVIPAGEAGGEISVNVSGDLLDENDETFFVTLTGARNAQLGATTVSTVTITDNDAAPTVTISDPTATEGGNAIFTVTLSTASERDVTIRWVTENGTATGGDGSLNAATQGDFKQFTLEQTLVIPAGQTTGSIVVQTVNDSQDETAETFGVRILETSENVTVAAGGIPGTATIPANDLSVLSITDATVIEGNSGTVTLVFTVSRAGSGNQLPVTVNYSTSDGTASASAGDYVAASGTLTIPSGQSSATISVTVNGDALSELDETLFVTLRDPVNATIGDASGIGTIRNDEVTYKLVPVTGQSLTVDEEAAGGGEQIVEFRVIRQGALDKPGSVFFQTAADDTPNANTATSGTDFFSLNGSVSFAVGASEASQTVKVRIKPDTTPEGVETFKLRLVNPVNGVLSETESERIITINESDTGDLPRVVIEDARVLEGTGTGTTTLSFKVKLVGADGTTPKATGGNVVVRYEALSGTAIAGEDFVLPDPDASITIPAGQTEATVSIQILRDAVDEADETFSVNILGAELTVPGVTSAFPLALEDGSAEGVIANDDLTLTLDPVLPSAEGNTNNVRTFTFRIAQASQHDVSVTYTLKDGTAVSTGDFPDFDAGTPTGTVTIPAGQTEVSFTVLIHGDLYSEQDETFTIEFSDVVGAVISSNSATVTLLNDDAAPSLTVGDASVVEGNGGQQELVFTVTLAGGTQESVTVNFATGDGTARSTGQIVDYTARQGTLTFPASATGGTQEIRVPVFGDTWRELDETFTVTLSDAKRVTSGAAVALADATATGTILDDGDTNLGLTLTGSTIVEDDLTGGTLSFLIETTAPVTGSTLSFVANTRPGTAQAADFTAVTNQAVSIPAGESSATVTVRATGDTSFEVAEFMFLDLSGFPAEVTPFGASGGTLSARGIILNDDVNVINSRSFQYVDLDGDIVTVKLSKGSLNIPTGTSLSSGDITFIKGGTPNVGGRFLQLLNLANDGNEFAGTNIKVTARVQVLPDGRVLGDGKAGVGAIEAAVPVPGLFQFTTGVQLGKVEVSGDLGRVLAGNTLRPDGVKVLKVGSLGDGTNLPDSTVGLAANTSVILGPVGKLTTTGDFAGSLLIIGDAVNAPIPAGPVGIINKLVVKGNLKGGEDFGSGRILTTGGINSATLGGVLGGSGDASASIQGVSGFSTTIGKLKILGDIVGGSGAGSANIDASRIGKVNIGQAGTKTKPEIVADIIGGSGESSARVTSTGSIGKLTMNGSIEGGAGASSGQIFARNTVAKTRITGDVTGGSGGTSGSLVVGSFSSSLKIEGSLRGGSGLDSGVVATNGITDGLETRPGNLSSLTIGKSGVADSGDIIGGSGTGSGRVALDGNLSKFVLHGDVVGGTNASTGGFAVDGRIGSGTIKGDLIGGSTKSTTDGGPATLLRSGFIVGSGISSLVIEGRIITGKNEGTSLGGSALIASAGGIGSITVNGTGSTTAVLGNSSAAAVISARDSINKLRFGGDVQFAEILAGYSPVSTATAPRGTLTNLDATIGKLIVDGTLRSSSIVAGVNAGGDGVFGTIDDQSTLPGAGQPPATSAVSKIASVIATAVAAAAGAPADASYGIVAEHVKSVKVGGTAVPLLSGPHNDEATEVGGAASKLKVLET